MLALCLALALSCILNAGCGQQVVLVPPGRVVRLAEPVTAKVGIPDGHGGETVSGNRVKIPAGYYAVPPPAN